jgi:transposase
MSAPGIGWVLAFTIAAEIGDIERFSSPEKLTGYTGSARASTSRETQALVEARCTRLASEKGP